MGSAASGINFARQESYELRRQSVVSVFGTAIQQALPGDLSRMRPFVS